MGCRWNLEAEVDLSLQWRWESTRDESPGGCYCCPKRMVDLARSGRQTALWWGWYWVRRNRLRRRGEGRSSESIRRAHWVGVEMR